MIHRHHLVLCSMLMCLALAGCGSETSSTATSPPAAIPPATSPPVATAPAIQQATSSAVTSAPTEAPRPTRQAAAPSPASDAGGTIELRQVASGLKRPVYVTHAGDGSGRLFVVEKAGTIALLQDGEPADAPFLDITTLVDSAASERGLLGLAFHPDYAQNGRFFVYYTARNGDNTLARYQVSNDPDRADPSSGVVLLAVPDPAANHNGGMLAFGPDGYLYVGMGDGGSGGDPWGNGQNRAVLLGKLLRLDVDGGDPYAIPPDNPWPDSPDARPEVWAYGLRNPWRFSFDRTTGDLYIGDVGQNAYEEIHLQRAGSAGGQNYGWNVMEGNHCYRANSCDQSQFVAPIAEYSHSDGCTIVGGYVYRGAAFPKLQGAYFFADYCSGQIWTLHEQAGAWQRRSALATRLNISSFGEDEAGELYLTSLGDGGLYQVVEAGQG